MRPHGHRLRWMGRLDGFALAAVGALALIGILFIYSAGYRGEGMEAAPFYRRQVLWALAGGFALLVAAAADYRRLAEQSLWFYLIGLALLGLVLLVGAPVYGARRWLSLFGIQVQPSEFAKLATILALARLLGRPDLKRNDPWRLAAAVLLVAPAFVLIAAGPDLGSAAVLIPVVFVMLFVAGVPLRWLALLALAGLLLLPAGWLVMGEYQRERVRVFLEPGRDPLGAGWSKIQSQIAIGSGGLRGKGYLQGTQNVLGFLPRTVAPTDFIFSVVAEETGFAGAAGVLALYAVTLASGVRTALRARDKTGQLLAAGLVALLFTHVFVNVGMTVGLLPVTGLPLPLISYGGSFMVSTMLALGLIQSVHVRRPPR